MANAAVTGRVGSSFFTAAIERPGASDQFLGRRVGGPVFVPEHRVRKWIILVINLVADAPHDHAGMIAVPAHHVRDVRDRPLVKQLRVPEAARHTVVSASDPFVLGRRELVKGLVHDQQAEPVTQIQQLRRGRIVTGANGVGAQFLQNAQAAFKHLVRHCRTRGSRRRDECRPP